MFKTFWTLKIINALFIISCVACLALALASFSGTAVQQYSRAPYASHRRYIGVTDTARRPADI